MPSSGSSSPGTVSGTVRNVVLVHGAYADSGPLSAKLVQNGTLKTYHGYPHGMPTTHADVINADLLAWLQQ